MTNIDEALDAAIANNTDEAVLGLDIGGTSIKMGVVTRVGKVLATAKVPTGELDNAEAFDRVSTSAVALVREAGKDPETLGAIGIDVPGVVLEDGTLAMTPNIVLDLAGLTAALKAAFPIARTRALNDANAAAVRYISRNYCVLETGRGLLRWGLLALLLGAWMNGVPFFAKRVQMPEINKER